ncbi:hypothetical protein [Paeniglutamicibacter kerguelensis]|uniref:DUF2530 domain-containing protein n=1 Tax=Paeniglutamicibacter kerguelensis TaxID=254788 RepID=A0ABS4X8I0_9MICC|nr:hypothetical protein [Paeniglutamicibacter kerguelensis]MBP2384775.1 hypothetical protein [Paeniglutamicibacter kerguelensis]
MTQNPQIPEPREEPTPELRVPPKHRSNGLLIGGSFVAALFLIFIITSNSTMDGAINPLWIGFIVGILVAGLGVFRIIRGPSAFGLGDVEHKHPEP